MSVFDERKYPTEMPLAQMQLRTRAVVPNLKAQRQELQMRIDKIDRLLAVLEKHPEFVQIIDLSREFRGRASNSTTSFTHPARFGDQAARYSENRQTVLSMTST